LGSKTEMESNGVEVGEMTESEFKQWFRKQWLGWVESYEPRRGSGVGIPDLQIVAGGRIVPIELKIGTIKDGVLYPREVRPVQIAWHRKLNDAGIASILLIGVYDLVADDFVACAVDAQYMRNWRHGYKHYVKLPVKDKDLFTSVFSAWCSARSSN